MIPSPEGWPRHTTDCSSTVVVSVVQEDPTRRRVRTTGEATQAARHGACLLAPCIGSCVACGVLRTTVAHASLVCAFQPVKST